MPNALLNWAAAKQTSKHEVRYSRVCYACINPNKGLHKKTVIVNAPYMTAALFDEALSIGVICWKYWIISFTDIDDFKSRSIITAIKAPIKTIYKILYLEDSRVEMALGIEIAITAKAIDAIFININKVNTEIVRSYWCSNDAPGLLLE